jgi:hypothetical protein
VADELARLPPVRLVVVGDSNARDQVEERAAVANARAGRRAVVLSGKLMDPAWHTPRRGLVADPAPRADLETGTPAHVGGA